MTTIARKDIITFVSKHINDVTVLKGDAPIKVTDGFGGWTVVDRPHRRGLTVFTGPQPFRMDVPVLFDGWQKHTGQEHEISRLSRMGRMQGEEDEPPVIRVRGYGIPDTGVDKWVIENIQWGDNVIWDRSSKGDLVRLRQDATVQMMEYVAPDRIKLARLASQKPGSGIWPKHYVIHHHDTLQKIAKKFYHDHTKWKIIAQANGIHDPKHLKSGRIITIPRPQKKKRKHPHK
jgi:hypothetical protein